MALHSWAEEEAAVFAPGPTPPPAMAERKRKLLPPPGPRPPLKRYAPAHFLEAQDFQCPSTVAQAQSQGSLLEDLPAEVITRIGKLLNARDLAALESSSPHLLAVARRHVWPTLRSFKISHYSEPQDQTPSTSTSLPSTLLSGASSPASTSKLLTSIQQPASSGSGVKKKLKVALSVGNQYYEDVVSERGLSEVARRLTGLRTLTFGVQARIQSKADYEQIYHEHYAREYRERSETLMASVVDALPERLPVTSITVGSYFEMSPNAARLITRLSGTLKSITMSFRWIHRHPTRREIQEDADGWAQVWAAIGGCEAVEVLKVYKTSMAELGSGPVLASVAGKPRLSRLCLVCEGFTGAHMAHIIAAIPEGNLKVLFLEPNGGSALEELGSGAAWAGVGKEVPADPSLHLGRLRKFGFSSRDHLNLPSAIPMLPALWEILIVGRQAGPQLLQEVTDLTVDYLFAKRHSPTVKPICIRIHTEDDRWRDREPDDPEYHKNWERDERFGDELMRAVRDRTRCHTVRMEVAGKWGFRMGNASVVVTGEKPTPPNH